MRGKPKVNWMFGLHRSIPLQLGVYRIDQVVHGKESRKINRAVHLIEILAPQIEVRE